MDGSVMSNPLYNESQRTRDDDAFYREEADRREPPPTPGSRRVVARTVDGGSYPTHANRFFKMVAVDVTGDVVEGGPGTLTEGEEFFAYNVGSAIPEEGSDHICTTVPYRWVFRHD